MGRFDRQGVAVRLRLWVRPELPADLELGIFNVAMAMYERNENDMKKASLKMGRRYGLKRALVA